MTTERTERRVGTGEKPPSYGAVLPAHPPSLVEQQARRNSERVAQAVHVHQGEVLPAELEDRIAKRQHTHE